MIASLKTLLSMCANLLAVVFILLEINNANKIKKNDCLNYLLAVIAIFALFSGLYGFYNGVVLDFGSYKRFCGTIDDPNYSVMLYSFGIFCGLATKLFKRPIKILVFLGLLFVSFMTVSISGLIFILFGIIVYLAFTKPKAAVIVLILTIIFAVLFLVIPLDGTPLYSFQFRINNIIRQVLSGDFSAATSGRTAIWAKYIAEFKNLSFIDKLFGGYDTVNGAFRDYMVGIIGNVSHNSYIDMLFYCGIIGTTVIVSAILVGLVKNFILFLKQKNKVYLAIGMAKLVILYYSLNLSMFPFRYFISFVLF